MTAESGWTGGRRRRQEPNGWDEVLPYGRFGFACVKIGQQPDVKRRVPANAEGGL